MRKKPLLCTDSDNGITKELLIKSQSTWEIDAEYRRLSETTVANREIILKNFFWFMDERKVTTCDTSTVKAFLAYVSNGHTDKGGRWGNPHLTKQVKPLTVGDYHKILHAFFEYLVLEEVIEESPMSKMRPPKVSRDQIQPFPTIR